jgi:hypothetical protein
MFLRFFYQSRYFMQFLFKSRDSSIMLSEKHRLKSLLLSYISSVNTLNDKLRDLWQLVFYKQYY